MSLGSNSYGSGSAESPDPVAASEPVEVITQGVIDPDLLQTWLAVVDIVHPKAPLVFDGDGIHARSSTGARRTRNSHGRWSHVFWSEEVSGGVE